MALPAQKQGEAGTCCKLALEQRSTQQARQPKEPMCQAPPAMPISGQQTGVFASMSSVPCNHGCAGPCYLADGSLCTHVPSIYTCPGMISCLPDYLPVPAQRKRFLSTHFAIAYVLRPFAKTSRSAQGSFLACAGQICWGTSQSHSPCLALTTVGFMAPGVGSSWFDYTTVDIVLNLELQAYAAYMPAPGNGYAPGNATVASASPPPSVPPRSPPSPVPPVTYD